MRLHLRPRAYSRTLPAFLLDFKIPELGLHLRAGRDLTTACPYPNKCYSVGSRKVSGSRKLVDGLLIATDKALREFTTISDWSYGDSRVATHLVNYKLVDQEFDTVSDKMLFWSATAGGELGVWSNRWPEDVGGPPATAEPRMEFVVDDHLRRVGDVRDTVNDQNQITHRHETFWLPTIEPERLGMWRGREHRVPLTEHAFHA